ncbi:MAG: WecB/TagA/CpsF family glycosyltransferase [Alphaproteobacteria bacterium]|nr:WecB/TagA/CpsF family glycosyltransferase [Alphaproteobacteria bacterium]
MAALLLKKSGLNMNGTDLIPRIIRLFKGRKVAVCGTSEPWLSRACDVIREMGCEVVLQLDGFLERDAYLRPVFESRADLLILGMGMPKQEAVAAYISEQATRPILILNSGAALDFMANRFQRAPAIWRKSGFEWLFRFIQEPRRLAGRYLVGGFMFLFTALRLAALNVVCSRGGRS